MFKIEFLVAYANGLECGREDMLALLSNSEFQPRENSCAMDFLFLAHESYIENI